jgi:urea carboxylase-associated protein 1
MVAATCIEEGRMTDRIANPMDGVGEIVEDSVIPARGSWSRRIERGRTLRIIDLEGRQAVDFLCYDAHDHDDRYAAADTMKINPTGIFMTTGTVLYGVKLAPLFTITADTCGKHDTIGGCCSDELNALRYGAAPGPSCRANFLAELARHGMGPRDMAANINFFMYVPVGADGVMDVGPSLSKPGDYVDLRAETDVLAVISNCPQINNPVNDYNPTPIRVVVWGGP